MYGIDRDTLKFLGITEINVDRLYRALFVYSIGFYELISLITSGIKSKDQSKHSQIIGAVWTVYSILLEFCCKADYKLLISQIAVDYENEKQKLKSIIERNNEVFLDREKDLKDQFKDIQKDYDELLEARLYYKKYTDKLNDIIDDLRAKIEEETKIRKLFENKLNDLHSIVRDKEAGYSRAKEDLDYLLQDNIEKEHELEELRQSYKDSEQVKIAYQIKFETTNHSLTNAKKELEFEKASHLREVSKMKSEHDVLRKHSDKIEREYAQLRKQYEDKVVGSNCIALNLEKEK